MKDWIPASERLPEEDKLVLITVNGKYNNKILTLGYYSSIDGWALEAYPKWLEPNVTAWMPLPEPYKEENEDAI